MRTPTPHASRPPFFDSPANDFDSLVQSPNITYMFYDYGEIKKEGLTSRKICKVVDKPPCPSKLFVNLLRLIIPSDSI